MIDFNNVPILLRRFEYAESTVLGFCYFLGMSALVAKEGETSIDDVQERLAQLPDIEIDAEIESLIGPLDDRELNQLIDELVWRFRGEFEPRSINFSETSDPIFAFEFRNHGRIFSDDRKVENLGSAEEIFSKAMYLLGRQFLEKDYDPAKCFKSGLCSTNLRATIDIKTTHASLAYLEKFLPLIFGAARGITRKPFFDWGQHLDVQVPLQVFLHGVNPELGEMIWAYQSRVFYKDKKLKQGINELNVLDFMKVCKETLIGFFSEHPHQCIGLALQRYHWSAFPPLINGSDERRLILEVLQHTLGYNNSELRSYSYQSTLKALLLFGYYCSLCETILLENGETRVQ